MKSKQYNFIDMTGKRFGKYIVVSRGGTHSSGIVKWVCNCDCGTVREVLGTSLRNGESTGCGCGPKKWATKHGLSHMPEYYIWVAIKNRCNNKNNKSYANYGGRGISVCERWLNDVSAFIKDVGPRPSNRHSIDRIDNSKGYYPENCRWATRIEQASNKRNNLLIETPNGKMTIAQAARSYNINSRTLYERFKRGCKGEKLFSHVKNNLHKG